MSNIKRYLEEISEDLGLDGEINETVLAEATRRMNIEVARAIIVGHLTFHNVSPDSYELIDGKEWEGEYGKAALLILIHEDPDVSAHTSLANARVVIGDYSSYEKLMGDLQNCGLFIEQCTLWYSGIYANEALELH
jgi:hypothetical protein